MQKRTYLVSVLFSFAIAVNAQESKVFKTFYPHGKLKSVSHEGLFNGCSMPVGTDSIFYPTGELQTTVVYENTRGKTGAGCHGTWTVASAKTYFKNGRLQTSTQQKYSYEGKPCNCGTWQRKNAEGKIIENNNYGDCYNQLPCNDPG